MADNNAPLGPNDRVNITRRDADGVGTPGSVPPDLVTQAAFTPGENIADVTPTNGADSDGPARLAINGILAILEANGLMEPSA